MELILWRHAEAEDLCPGQDDLERQLTPKGLKQAERMAAWLDERLPKDARILVSPAQRTQQTAVALCRPCTTIAELAPWANYENLSRAAGWPHKDGTVVIVGHQPTLGQLASWIMTGTPMDWAVKKGAIWWFRATEADGQWTANLESVMSPKQLGKG